MSALDALLYGIRYLFANGDELPQRDTVKLLGNITAVDNPTEECTEVTFTAASGVIDLSDLGATTGVLPVVRQEDQAMGGDVQGTTGANNVVALAGNFINALTSTVRGWYDNSFVNGPVKTFRETGVAVSGGGALVLFSGYAIQIVADRTYLVDVELVAHDVSGGSASSYKLSETRYVDSGGTITTLGTDTVDAKLSGDATAVIVWPPTAGGYLTVEGGPVLAGDVVYNATLTIREIGLVP